MHLRPHTIITAKLIPHSDILAELDFPQSPILGWESTMPWPDLATAVDTGLNLQNMGCYNALLWLRKRLNHIHTALYGPGIQDRRWFSSPYSISSHPPIHRNQL